MDATLTALELSTVLKHTLALIGQGDDFRLVYAARRLQGEVQLRQIWSDGYKHVYHIQVVQAIRGGGPQQPPRAQTKNALATVLLERNHDLRWVGRSIDKVLDVAGIQKVSQAIQKPQGDARYEAVVQLLRDCDVTVQTESVRAIPNAMGSKKRLAELPDFSEFVIKTGYFTHEDGTSAVQLSKFCPQSCGIYLASQQLSAPWLRESQVLAKDELAMLVVGVTSPSTTLKSQQVAVPCTSPQGDQVILAAALIQFGEKHILIEKSPHQTSATPNVVLAVTVWKQDWPEEDWQKCLQATTSFVRSHFEQGASLFLSTWGRSLRHHRKPVLAEHASSVQLHTSVTPDKLDGVLSASGFNRIFCTPKRKDGRPDDVFKVVWIQGDWARVTSLACKVERCLGLVRGKDGLGLRLHRDHFVAAWQVINPSLPVPLLGAQQLDLYKIEPLPCGTTAVALEEWSKTLPWNVKPIKPLGSTAWLIGSSDKAPDSFLQFNSTPVIAKYLPPRAPQRTSLVLAGIRLLPRIQHHGMLLMGLWTLGPSIGCHRALHLHGQVPRFPPLRVGKSRDPQKPSSKSRPLVLKPWRTRLRRSVRSKLPSVLKFLRSSLRLSAGHYYQGNDPVYEG